MNNRWLVQAEHQMREHARAEAWVFRIKQDENLWGILVEEKTRYKTRFEPSFEKHDDLDEFIVCLEGQYWVKVGSWTRTLSPGEMAIIPSGTEHDSGIATNLVGIHFLILLFPKELKVACDFLPGGILLPPGALSWIKGCFKFLRNSPNERGIIPLSILPEFIRDLRTEVQLPADSTHPDPIVGDLLKLLEQPEAPNLENLASTVGLTQSHLQRRFMLAVGTSPLQYARAWQLDKIAEVLKSDSTLSATDIALEFGFNDPKHFRSSFKKRFGILPGAYRKNHPSK